MLPLSLTAHSGAAIIFSHLSSLAFLVNLLLLSSEYVGGVFILVTLATDPTASAVVF